MTSRIDMTGQELRELVCSMAPQSTQPHRGAKEGNSAAAIDNDLAQWVLW